MKQREIKFRYWNTISNIMVNNPEIPYKKGWTIEQLFSDRGWIWQQFTGLYDKNNKPIYEGDIVSVKTLFDDKDNPDIKEYFYPIATVEWISIGAYFCFHWNWDKSKAEVYLLELGTTTDSYSLFSIFNEKENPVEVIGNIYENPELIKSLINNK